MADHPQPPVEKSVTMPALLEEPRLLLPVAQSQKRSAKVVKMFSKRSATESHLAIMPPPQHFASRNMRRLSSKFMPLKLNPSKSKELDSQVSSINIDCAPDTPGKREIKFVRVIENSFKRKKAKNTWNLLHKKGNIKGIRRLRVWWNRWNFNKEILKFGNERYEKFGQRGRVRRAVQAFSQWALVACRRNRYVDLDQIARLHSWSILQRIAHKKGFNRWRQALESRRKCRVDMESVHQRWRGLVAVRAVGRWRAFIGQRHEWNHRQQLFTTLLLNTRLRFVLRKWACKCEMRHVRRHSTVRLGKWSARHNVARHWKLWRRNASLKPSAAAVASHLAVRQCLRSVRRSWQHWSLSCPGPHRLEGCRIPPPDIGSVARKKYTAHCFVAWKRHKSEKARVLGQLRLKARRLRLIHAMERMKDSIFVLTLTQTAVPVPLRPGCLLRISTDTTSLMSPSRTLQSLASSPASHHFDIPMLHGGGHSPAFCYIKRKNVSQVVLEPALQRNHMSQRFTTWRLRTKRRILFTAALKPKFGFVGIARRRAVPGEIASTGGGCTHPVTSSRTGGVRRLSAFNVLRVHFTRWSKGGAGRLLRDQLSESAATLRTLKLKRSLQSTLPAAELYVVFARCFHVWLAGMTSDDPGPTDEAAFSAQAFPSSSHASLASPAPARAALEDNIGRHPMTFLHEPSRELLRELSQDHAQEPLLFAQRWSQCLVVDRLVLAQHRIDATEFAVELVFRVRVPYQSNPTGFSEAVDVSALKAVRHLVDAVNDIKRRLPLLMISAARLHEDDPATAKHDSTLELVFQSMWEKVSRIERCLNGV